MNKLLPLILAWLLPLSAHATSVPQKPLDDLVRESDHVFVATVVKVDMVNGKGKAVKDKTAMTGPGLENEIRFHLEIREVLFTKSPQPPKSVIVRLWKAWHYQLGDIQDAVTGSTSIFLLKGSEFDPVYPAHFQRSLEEREEIHKLVSKLLTNR